MSKPIATLALCLFLLPAARAQEAAELSQQQLVERILELQRQIEELLAALPPDLRAELRQRLAGAEAAATATAAATETTPAAPAPEAAAAAPATEASAAPATSLPSSAAAAPGAPPVIADASDATAAETAPSAGIPKLIQRRPRRAPCNTLGRLDGNGDGKLDAADRYWRYLYLWTDRNGDRRLQDREVESAYDLKVREIATSLETFVRARGGLGEMRVEDRVVLDLRGDGFSERARRDDAVLVVDADALGRGDGPRLLDRSGEPLGGFQPFRAGLRLELAGEVTTLNCP